jgi:lysozyme
MSVPDVGCVELALKLTSAQEGFEPHIYNDNGHEAIGYGDDLLDATPADLARFHKDGISQPEALSRLAGKLAAIADDLRGRLGFWNDLNAVRQAVLIGMAYQMGVPGLMDFKRMRGYLAQGLYVLAAAEGLRSQWALQTPNRAELEMKMLEDGK